MSDPIKAALGVAASARCLVGLPLMERNTGPCKIVCGSCQKEAAAAIAAFLEALPVGMRDVPGRVETRDGAAILPHYLAAAVRRAAGGE